MDFIQQNILYVVMAVVSGAMLLFAQFQSRGNLITPQQATLLINRDDALVLDIREANEFSSGHLQGARNIPLSRLEEAESELQKFKEKPIIVCCASGVRSGKACTILKKFGFEPVHGLEGGVAAWVTAGLPLSKGKKS